MSVEVERELRTVQGERQQRDRNRRAVMIHQLRGLIRKIAEGETGTPVGLAVVVTFDGGALGTAFHCADGFASRGTLIGGVERLKTRLLAEDAKDEG